MIQDWQKECIRLYAENATSGMWDIKRCTDTGVLNKIEEIVKANGGDYGLFIRMMESYYDAERCPPGDYGTGNPHRDMEAEAYDSAWRHFNESCSKFGLPSSDVKEAI